MPETFRDREGWGCTSRNSKGGSQASGHICAPLYVFPPPGTQGLQPRYGAGQGIGQKLVGPVLKLSLFNQSSVSCGTMSLSLLVTPCLARVKDTSSWAGGEMTGRHQQQGLQYKETARKGCPQGCHLPTDLLPLLPLCPQNVLQWWVRDQGG